MEELDLINGQNKVIGKAPRKEIEKKGLLYRCAGVYVLVGGKICVQKRASSKKIRPLHYSIVEETVKSGETFKQAAIRGVKEEIGLGAKNLKALGEITIKDQAYNDNFLFKIFSAEGTGKISIDKNEVDSAKLLSFGGAKKLLASKEKTSPGFSKSFKMFEGSLE